MLKLDTELRDSTYHNNLVGQDLSGFQVVIWWHAAPNENGHEQFFSDHETAVFASSGRGPEIIDLKPQKVYVLTKDNRHGYLLPGLSVAHSIHTKKDVIERAKETMLPGRLSPIQKEIAGIEK